ncbi:hypothetical protein BLNAU_16457 [Blattamonas nauphoetae]|uniref:Uncharacterized protein n=1 Tax=Blattamonas nauphoetae TaxID=2049346 RepID=A0ABQ9X8B0_9EUKA|nr:hypothetical protein BLNAU_16457 [Blattamonas nauphoetae]
MYQRAVVEERVDPAIRESILFFKDAIPTVLSNMTSIDDIIASLQPNSAVSDQTLDSLRKLLIDCEDFVLRGCEFFARKPFMTPTQRKTPYQSIVLDDPSFPDLFINSLKLGNQNIRTRTFMTITEIIDRIRWMREKWSSANLVGRVFETVNFVSHPRSETQTHLNLTRFISTMMNPIQAEMFEEAFVEDYALIRVSVLEPAEPYIIFLFHNVDTPTLGDENAIQLEKELTFIHRHITNIELRSDEHDTEFLSELVRWEVGQMVEMEREGHFVRVFNSITCRIRAWKLDYLERLKRRAGRLREEGWEDAFKLRAMGIEEDTWEYLVDLMGIFRLLASFNSDLFDLENVFYWFSYDKHLFSLY